MLLSVCVGWAQMDKGTITGTVTDSSGAVVPGVKVDVTNVVTGAVYGGLTNQVGIYTVLNLPVGEYTAHYSRDGFRALDRTGLNLTTGQVLRLNVALQVGSESQTVVVNAEPPLLKNETSEVGIVLDADSITDLPMDVSTGRNASNLFFQTIPVMHGSNYSGEIAGSQQWSKTALIDGTDGNTGMQGFVQPPDMDAIAEMSVQISGIGSEGAATGGGVLMYEIKSGTNQLHGTAYGFLRHEWLDSNTWANNYFLSQCAKGDTSCD